MLEEEIKIGEQEREALRIETQRLRDELSDIKVELEITQDKLRNSEETIERDRNRKVTPLATESLRPPSPMSEASTSATTISTPGVSTPPPAKSDTSTLQTTPPSPPVSDSAPTKKKPAEPFTPLPTRKRPIPMTTPRPSTSAIRPPRHSRGPSIPHPTPTVGRTGLPPKTPTSKIGRPSLVGPATERGPPRSESLHQIRGLIGKMQKLEQRVHTARSKLPAPAGTPPRGSPRSSGLTAMHSMPSIPSSVTVRSARKRASASTTTSNYTAPSTEPRPSSRLSFGYTAKDGSGLPRPESRTSYARPGSRASITGRSTPLGHDMPMHRPRSSISGSYAAMHGDMLPPRSTTPGPTKMSSHAPSRSVSHAVAGAESGLPGTPSTARRSTLDRNGLGKSIGPPGLARRQSGGLSAIPAPGRRQSGASAAGAAVAAAADAGDMRPPSSRGRRLSGVGETF
jgi:hypothetical protein